MNQDPLQIVGLRNEFYRDNYRRVLSAVVFLVIIAIVQTALIAYLVITRPAPTYFAASSNGRIMPLVPLDEPNLSTSALLQWATQAAVAAYTYNYVNYRKELQAASEFFTPEGWQSFLEALDKSKNLTTVIERKLVVSAIVTGAPVILEQGVRNGRYTWRVQMPITVTYQGANTQRQETYALTLLIGRVSTLQSVSGVGIAQLVASTGDVLELSR